MQENSFKRMIDHGALKTNYGRKKIVGPDRHQQRAKEKLDHSLGVAQKRVTKKTEPVKTQQDKVVESEHKGHSKRLAQRQRALAVVEQERKDAQHKHDKLVAYLRIADNISGPLASQRMGVNPLGIRTRNAFAIPHASPLVCI